MPAVGRLETREAETRDIVLLSGKKAFEGLGETISKHLYRSSRYMLALSFECCFKFILAGKCPVLPIVHLDRLKHAIVNGARLSQTSHELMRLFFIHEQAVLKCSYENILPKSIRIASEGCTFCGDGISPLDALARGPHATLR